MQVAVVGLGYVGLVTAACLSRWGHSIMGVEADPERLQRLRSGDLPFHEPGLADLVAACVSTGALRFYSRDELALAVHDADAAIVAVGTHDGNGGWQTGTMTSTLSELVPLLADDTPVVIRSTLPPAYIASLPQTIRTIRHEARGRPLPLLLNPEFTREGQALQDFNVPDRVVLGILDDPHGIGESVMRVLYRAVSAPVMVMPAIDAAFSKLASNLFLATKISFANELASLCESYGADVVNVVSVMGQDPRIGPEFLGAGIGFGGSCLPHQVSMTVMAASDVGLEAPLLTAVDRINHEQRRRFADRLFDLAPVDAARIGLLGLAFKPGTDDLRDAPSLTVAGLLLARGAAVTAYDPMPAARLRAAHLMPGLKVVATVEEALAGVDAIGLVTEWPEFRRMSWNRLSTLPRNPVVLDGRSALNAGDLHRAGFTYEAFGRRAQTPTAFAATTTIAAPPAAPAPHVTEARPGSRVSASTALSD